MKRLPIWYWWPAYVYLASILVLLGMIAFQR